MIVQVLGEFRAGRGINVAGLRGGNAGREHRAKDRDQDLGASLHFCKELRQRYYVSVIPYG
jgi:hypothetical protein